MTGRINVSFKNDKGSGGSERITATMLPVINDGGSVITESELQIYSKKRTPG
jgi:hypothetical protein